MQYEELNLIVAHQECNDNKLRTKQYGAKRAEIIGRRLDDLRAAATLDVMRGLPGKCHELTSNLSGKFAIHLDEPYRLIFAPANNPIIKNSGGGIDLTKVTSIRIIGIVDYHGK